MMTSSSRQRPSIELAVTEPERTRRPLSLSKCHRTRRRSVECALGRHYDGKCLPSNCPRPPGRRVLSRFYIRKVIPGLPSPRQQPPSPKSDCLYWLRRVRRDSSCHPSLNGRSCTACMSSDAADVPSSCQDQLRGNIIARCLHCILPAFIRREQFL
jgi:hypothetical protein